MTEGVVDTTSPAGELIFSVFAALAQFEGGLIQERTQAGLGAVLRHYSYFRKLLTIPTASFNILFVLVILHHCRRKVVHFNVTSNPSAQWTAQQVLEAFPWDTAPKYLMRDRDSIYGVFFRNRVKTWASKKWYRPREALGKILLLKG